jgi:hypothetical protein
MASVKMEIATNPGDWRSGNERHNADRESAYPSTASRMHANILEPSDV